MYFNILVEHIETNIHLEQNLDMLTKTWKYDGSVSVQRLLDDLKEGNP